MNKKKSLPYWIVIVVISVFALGIVVNATGGFSWSRVEDKVAQIKANEIPAPVEEENTEPIIGSLTSPNINSPYLCIAGVCTEYNTVSMQTATNTLCVVKPNSNATTTLNDFRFSITTGTSSASVISLATSSSRYVTSSAWTLGQTSVVANTGTTWVATSTMATTQLSATWPYTNPVILRPNEYVLLYVFSGSGVTLGGYTYDGKCKATFGDF